MRDIAELLFWTMVGGATAGVGLSALVGYLFFRMYRGFK